MIVASKYIYTENGIVNGYLLVEDGKIRAILGAEEEVGELDVDATNQRIIPGIFDTHNHGTLGYNMMSEMPDIEGEIKGYLKGLASQGVTAIFPTAYYGIFSDIAKVAKQNNDGAKIVGIHSEGPYLNRVGEKGIDTGHPDVDMALVRKMVEDSEGLLKLVALAPEIPGTDQVIDYLTALNIRVAFAHSNDNYAEAQAAFASGVSVSTHTANVMSGIHHRNMGGLGACLLNDEVWCEVIGDGFHVCDEMLRIMFRVKTWDKFMMISDCASISGAPVGRYNMMGFLPVIIDEAGFCLSDTGRLCGSTKPVLYDIGHLVQALGLPLETVIKMASLNPAKCYGFDKQKGSLAVGKDADFVIIDDDYRALATYSEGRKVYDSEVDTAVFNPAFMDMCKLD